jgi:hypothetical protein
VFGNCFRPGPSCLERMTGIEPALSAWELACHACCHMDSAGQPLFRLVRWCPSNTGFGSCIGHAAGTLNASGHEAVDKENDHAYDRPDAEYPDGTRPSLGAGAACGKPGDHHAYGNEDWAHREYPSLGCLACARCCCRLTQCPGRRQPGGRRAYRQSCGADGKVTRSLCSGSFRGIHPHRSMISRQGCLSMRTTGVLLLGWWKYSVRRMLKVADVGQFWGGCCTRLLYDRPLTRSFRVQPSTAASLIGAGFLVVLVPLDADDLRSVLARGWHGPPTYICRLLCHSVP